MSSPTGVAVSPLGGVRSVQQRSVQTLTSHLVHHRLPRHAEIQHLQNILVPHIVFQFRGNAHPPKHPGFERNLV